MYGPFISRGQAIEQNIKHFYVGQACKRGHLSARLISTRQCIECLKERSQRPEYKAAAKKRYFENHSERRAKANAYRTANKEKINAKNKEYLRAKRAPAKKKRQEERDQLRLIPRDVTYGPFISWKQAKEQGISHFYSGEPCKVGHVCPHRISGQCWECNGIFKMPISCVCETCGKTFYNKKESHYCSR